MKNKVLSVLLVSAMVATMLVGCGDKDASSNKGSDNKTEQGTDDGDKKETDDKETGDAKNPVTLKTVSMFDGTDPNQKAYKAIQEQFQKDYDYITLEDNSQKADQDWKAAVAADFAVGNEPDVIQYFTDAQANTVLATDKFVTIDEIRAEYPDFAKDTTEGSLGASKNPDGVNRAIPTNGIWEGLFCNTELFEQYKVEIPKDWDGLVAAVKTFKENGIIPIAVSLMQEPHYWAEHFMLYEAGIDEYASIPEEAPESWVKGLERFKTLRDLGAFPEDTDTVKSEYTTQLFYDGKAAMQLDGSWRLGGIVDAGLGDKVTVVPFPADKDSKAEYGTLVSGFTSGFYITKKAWDDPDKRDAAVKYVEANICKEGITQYWEANGKAGIWSVEMPKGENLSKLAEDGNALWESKAAVVPPTDARIGADPWTAVTSAASQISTGELAPADAINEALKLYKETN